MWVWLFYKIFGLLELIGLHHILETTFTIHHKFVGGVCQSDWVTLPASPNATANFPFAAEHKGNQCLSTSPLPCVGYEQQRSMRRRRTATPQQPQALASRPATQKAWHTTPPPKHHCHTYTNTLTSHPPSPASSRDMQHHRYASHQNHEATRHMPNPKTSLKQLKQHPWGSHSAPLRKPSQHRHTTPTHPHIYISFPR